jgi:hypothetical protein
LSFHGAPAALVMTKLRTHRDLQICKPKTATLTQVAQLSMVIRALLANFSEGIRVGGSIDTR